MGISMEPMSNSTLVFLGAMVTGMSAITLYVQYVEWKGRRVYAHPPPRIEEETDPNLIWQYRNRINQPRLKQEPEKVKEK